MDNLLGYVGTDKIAGFSGVITGSVHIMPASRDGGSACEAGWVIDKSRLSVSADGDSIIIAQPDGDGGPDVPAPKR